MTENSSTIRQVIVKNTLWFAGGTILARLIRAIMVLYAARVLGTAGYGLFSYALGITAFFTVFSGMGLEPILIRELVRDPQRERAYLGTAFFLKLAIVTISTTIMLVGSRYFASIEAIRPLIPIAAFLLITESLLMFTFSLFRAENRIYLEARFTLFTNIVITALGITALMLRPDPKTLVAAYVAGNAMGLLAATAALRKKLWGVWNFFDATLIKPILSAALPMATLGVMGTFMMGMDVIIIGWFRSEHELGLYGAAIRATEILYLIPGFLAIGLYPTIVRLIREREVERMRLVIEKANRILLGIALPITLGGAIVAAKMLTWVFGAPYAGAALTLSILFFTLPIVFAGQIMGHTAIAINAQRIFIPATLAGVVANAALDFLLIPPYGITGSAISTILALAITNGYIWHRLNRIFPLAITRHVGRIIAASGAMAAAVYIMMQLGIHVAGIIAGGGFIYFAALWILREPLLREFRATLCALKAQPSAT